MRKGRTNDDEGGGVGEAGVLLVVVPLLEKKKRKLEIMSALKKLLLWDNKFRELKRSEELRLKKTRVRRLWDVEHWPRPSIQLSCLPALTFAAYRYRWEVGEGSLLLFS